MLRLLLANDQAVRALDVTADLFSEPSYRAAFEVVNGLVEPLEPGVVPELGSEIGSDDQPEASLLRMLAMQQRPLPDADDVMKRLKQEAVERRIEEVQTELASIDADTDAQGYSERFERLIALQNERRELRSRE
jgi:septation ring formation regulator EzrA